SFPTRRSSDLYDIQTGINFLIRDVYLNVDDSVIKEKVTHSMKATLLKKGEAFSMSLVDEERSRITNLLKDEGYYEFNQDNIVNISLDTFNKSLLKDDYNPFESVINTLALQDQQQKNPTLDITIYIRADDNPNAYRQYYLNRIN